MNKEERDMLYAQADRAALITEIARLRLLLKELYDNMRHGEIFVEWYSDLAMDLMERVEKEL